MLNEKCLLQGQDNILDIWENCVPIYTEAGKGGVSVKDLRKVAIDHDFVWSDKEMADMIHLFDSDGDGKELRATVKCHWYLMN
ncbi:hypothetical protein IFM89_009963, partial [Coptis chinensis]